MEFGANMSSCKINTLLSLVNLTPSLYSRYMTCSVLTCKYSVEVLTACDITELESPLNKSTNITADPNKFLLTAKTELSINCPKSMNKFLFFSGNFEGSQNIWVLKGFGYWE